MTTRLGVIYAHADLDAHIAAPDVADVPAGGLVNVGGEAAVGGGKRQVAVHDAVPEHGAVLLELEGRVRVVFHAVGFLVPFRLEGQGQSQYLAVDRHAGGPGLGDHVRPVACGYVDEIHAHAGALGQPHHVAEGQVLDGLGVDQVDVVPVPQAALLGHQVVIHHQLVVFAVNGQHAAVAVHLIHQVAEAASVDAADGREAGALGSRRPDVGGEIS